MTAPSPVKRSQNNCAVIVAAGGHFAYLLILLHIRPRVFVPAVYATLIPY